MTPKKMRREVFDAFTAGFNAAREIGALFGDSACNPWGEQFEAAWKQYVAAIARIKEPAKGWPDWMTKKRTKEGSDNEDSTDS